jgi:hypothetical protein
MSARRRKKTKKTTYLSCAVTGTSLGWLVDAVLVAAAAGVGDVVTATTSENCCLKVASNSSPGFCELVLHTVSARAPTREACHQAEVAPGCIPLTKHGANDRRLPMQDLEGSNWVHNDDCNDWRCPNLGVFVGPGA